MKASNIQGINFGRAIRVEVCRQNWFDGKRNDFDSIATVIKTIKSDKNSVYDKETSRKIGAFLRAQIGDYDKKTGYNLHKINGVTYLFTGEEALKAREIINESKISKEMLNKKFNIESEGRTILNNGVVFNKEDICRVYCMDIDAKKNEKLFKIAENGIYNKPVVKLLLEMDDDKLLAASYYASQSGYEHCDHLVLC